ncbi:MAG TPA: 3-methyl-2-oxobutanoate hydroxymethyltransferase [Elusimicrobiales bacterium]|nr:3-methyl-2-oxobutanoate hydroxymethyltransferase [Elusimicrobiales bacterium]
MKITDFYRFRKDRKISIITCYDYCFAKIVSKSAIDSVLVGDSLAMTVYGYPSTIYATEEMMIRHTEAVRKGLGNEKLIITDMPFLSTRKGAQKAIETAGNLIKAGADAVKIENITGQERIIREIIESGIPVMGHLGVTPQYIKYLGNYSKKGKEKQEANDLIKDAVKMQKTGCFSIVLECVEVSIAKKISKKLKIAVIGIGSGKDTDGQVLVINDILGLFPSPPSFARVYERLDEKILNALNKFDSDVKGDRNGNI